MRAAPRARRRASASTAGTAASARRPSRARAPHRKGYGGGARSGALRAARNELGKGRGTGAPWGGSARRAARRVMSEGGGEGGEEWEGWCKRIQGSAWHRPISYRYSSLAPISSTVALWRSLAVRTASTHAHKILRIIMVIIWSGRQLYLLPNTPLVSEVNTL